jgi:hypothetical protein
MGLVFSATLRPLDHREQDTVAVRVRKISPPPGFNPRTAQSVEGRCTDCANPAAIVDDERKKLVARRRKNSTNVSPCLSTLFSKTLSLHSSLNVSDQLSKPYKTTGKITVL